MGRMFWGSSGIIIYFIFFLNLTIAVAFWLLSRLDNFVSTRLMVLALFLACFNFFFFFFIYLVEYMLWPLIGDVQRAVSVGCHNM